MFSSQLEFSHAFLYGRKKKQLLRVICIPVHFVLLLNTKKNVVHPLHMHINHVPAHSALDELNEITNQRKHMLNQSLPSSDSSFKRFKGTVQVI